MIAYDRPNVSQNQSERDTPLTTLCFGKKLLLRLVNEVLNTGNRFIYQGQINAALANI